MNLSNRLNLSGIVLLLAALGLSACSSEPDARATSDPTAVAADGALRAETARQKNRDKEEKERETAKREADELTERKTEALSECFKVSRRFASDLTVDSLEPEWRDQVRLRKSGSYAVLSKDWNSDNGTYIYYVSVPVTVVDNDLFATFLVAGELSRDSHSGLVMAADTVAGQVSVFPHSEDSKLGDFGMYDHGYGESRDCSTLR